MTSPDGKVTQAPVEDYTHSDGCYKVLFLGSKTGKHKGSVYVLGEDVNPAGRIFLLCRHRSNPQWRHLQYETTINHNLHPTNYDNLF